MSPSTQTTFVSKICQSRAQVGCGGRLTYPTFSGGYSDDFTAHILSLLGSHASATTWLFCKRAISG